MLPRFSWKEFSQTPNILSVTFKLILIIFFTSVIFYQDIGQVINLALSNAEVQYILLVPFVAAFFFYRQRKAFLFPARKNLLQDAVATATVLLALLIYIYGSYSLFPIELHLLTLPIFMAGTVLLLFGKDTLRALIFPIALLFFISPLPIFFSDRYGGYLIDSTTTLAAEILRLFLPITYSLRPTAIISATTSAGQPLSFEIAPACSGIYSLIAMVFLSAVFLYITSGSWLKKGLFTILAVVTAFLLNVLRIILTVSLGYSLGYGSVVEFFHNYGGTVLIFLGTFLLIFIADKILKMSFLKQPAPNCTHAQGSNICYRCGKIFRFPKKIFNWKRLSIIVILLLVAAALFLQAAATTYNKASNNQNNSIQLDVNSGNTTAFSGLTGLSYQFLGREPSAENQLGLFYVGDYYLYNANGTYVNAILEVSDSQSKFHTWEGCLNYQSTPMTIEKTTVLTLYDQQNTIVTAESMVANIPAYNQKLLLLYWFDSANLKINETSSPWALKITLYQTINNNTDTTDGTNNLIALGTQIENSWSQYKNPASGFSVDIYRNITQAFIVTTTVLVGSITILEIQSLREKRRLKIKATALPPEVIKQLNALTKTAETPKTETTSSDQIDQLKHGKFIKEDYVLINGQPYLQWKNRIHLPKNRQTVPL